MTLADKDPLLHIGRIVGVHGAKGCLKLYSFSEAVGLFDSGKRIQVRQRDGTMRVCTVTGLQPHKNLYRIFFEGVDDRSTAEALVDAELFMERTALPDPEEGSWYWCDLIGIDVYAADDAYIGKIAHVFATGANDVFVVRHGERETLIPAIESIVRRIDLDQKRMTVDLPEGL